MRIPNQRWPLGVDYLQSPGEISHALNESGTSGLLEPRWLVRFRRYSRSRCWSDVSRHTLRCFEFPHWSYTHSARRHTGSFHFRMMVLQNRGRKRGFETGAQKECVRGREHQSIHVVTLSEVPSPTVNSRHRRYTDSRRYRIDTCPDRRR